jgi:hypothetical protein
VPSGVAVIYDGDDDGWYTLGIAKGFDGGLVRVVSTSDHRAMPIEETRRNLEQVLDLENLSPVEPRGSGKMGSSPAEILQTLSGAHPRYARGQVLAEFRKGEPDRVRPWLVATDICLTLSEAGRPDRDVPLLAFEQGLDYAGPHEHRPSGGLRRPVGIANQVHFYATVPKDDFSQPVFEAWEFPQIPMSEAALSWDGKRLTGVAAIVERDGEINYDFLPDEASRATLAVETFVNNGELSPLDPLVRWGAKHVHGRVIDTLHKQVSGAIAELTVRHLDGEATMTRETFGATRFDGFSHRTLSPDPQIMELIFAFNTFNVSVFEREARVFNVLGHDRVIGVAYRGAPLEHEQRSSLRLLLAYASGNRSWHASTETFDEYGQLLVTVRRSYRTGSAIGTAPLLLDPWSSTNQLFAETFATMLDRIHEVRVNNPERLDAVVHRYFEGSSSSYPADRLLDMAVAIDALISLVMGTKQKPIIDDKPKFRALRKGLVKTLRGITRRLGLKQGDIGEFERMLNNLNKPAAAARARAFWTRIGISLTDLEKKALASRPYSVHESLYGDEGTASGLREKYDLSCVLINLFNRAFLSELGWRGKYRDALPGRRTRERNLALGDGRYVVKAANRKAMQHYRTYDPKREARLLPRLTVARSRRASRGGTSEVDK